MRSPDQTESYYFQASASSLGGVLEHPIAKIIPSQANVALPAVGGFATTRSEAFNLDEIVSCSAASTRVAGRRADQGHAFSTLVSSVVEGLNILEIVTAERLVAQISIDTPFDGSDPRISLVGSHFEGLKIGGRDAPVRINDMAFRSKMTWLNLQQMGRAQAETLLGDINKGDRNGWAWAADRYGWMTGRSPRMEGGVPQPDRFAICSLVDGVTPAIPGKSVGHIIEIAGFGRIFLGEVLVSRDSVQLSMVRAELGCNIHGVVNGGIAIGGGHMVPPSH
jgi:hypothetical protein